LLSFKNNNLGFIHPDRLILKRGAVSFAGIHLAPNNAHTNPGRVALARFKYTFLFLILFALGMPASSAWSSFPVELHEQKDFKFTVPPGLETEVNFWKKIYTRYTTRQVLIHDDTDLNIIYEVVDLGDTPFASRSRRKKVSLKIAKYKKILRKLAKLKSFSNLSYEEDRVARLVKKDFYKASKRIRDQLGQRDRFEEGLRRAGRYMPSIKRVFKEVGVPEELTVLPHVESSFQVNAYSSAGAAGVWQFTRGTGRRFMSINYEVDERRDPILAAYAAAKLLKFNYDEIQSWPLAITAYNHGLGGMFRAKKKHGPDIVKIVNNYSSRTFGFASRNFFAEFMAALSISKNPKKYFPDLVQEKPLKYSTVQLRNYVNVSTMMKFLNMSRSEVALYNPALRRPVLSGKKHIPKNYVFKAPAKQYPNLAALYDGIPDGLKYKKQVRSRWYRVRWGDNLITIANRLGTTVKQLKDLNPIGRRNRIYKGQVLEVPNWNSDHRKVTITPVKTDWSQYNFKVGQTFKYRVKRRDNLTRIARDHRVHVGVLAKINNMTDPHKLRPGQLINIPKNPDEVEATLITKKVAVKKKQVITPKPTVQVKNEVKITPTPETVLVSSQNMVQDASRPAFQPLTFAPSLNKEHPVGLIKVDFDETLSHFADWSQVSVSELRKLNNLRRRSSLRINQTLKIPLRRVKPDDFKSKRHGYHKAIQEDFYANFKVDKVVVRKVKKGETLWELSNDVYVIPLWLLGHYNPGKNLNTLSIGEPLKIPVLSEIKA